MNVVLLSCPWTFLASHLYSPISLSRKSFIFHVLLNCLLPVLSCVQRTKGSGLPDALQNRLTVPPFTAVIFFKGKTDGATNNVEKKTELRAAFVPKQTILSK